MITTPKLILESIVGEAQGELTQNAIFQALNVAEKNNNAPGFGDNCLRLGALWMNCPDERTTTCLKEKVPSLQPWGQSYHPGIRKGSFLKT